KNWQYLPVAGKQETILFESSAQISKWRTIHNGVSVPASAAFVTLSLNLNADQKAFGDARGTVWWDGIQLTSGEVGEPVGRRRDIKFCSITEQGTNLHDLAKCVDAVVSGLDPGQCRIIKSFDPSIKVYRYATALLTDDKP